MPTLPPFPPPPPVVPQSAAESLRLQKRPLQKAKRVQRRANAALRRIVIEAFLDAAARVMEEELRKRRLRSLVCTGGYWVVLGCTGGCAMWPGGASMTSCLYWGVLGETRSDSVDAFYIRRTSPSRFTTPPNPKV
jgi:hypothetical protein